MRTKRIPEKSTAMASEKQWTNQNTYNNRTHTSDAYKLVRASAPPTRATMLLQMKGAKKKVKPMISTVLGDGNQPCEIAL